MHGVYEWHILEPSLDRLITPLMFSFAGDAVRETLASTGLSPDAVFPAETLHLRLTAGGVRSVCVMPASFAVRRRTSRCCAAPRSLPARGAGGRAGECLRGARVVGARLRERVPADVRRADAQGRAGRAGRARGARRAARRRSPARCRASRRERSCWSGPTTAWLPISPERTSYVNVVWPELEQHLRRGADGKPLAPAGSCRDLFLHVLPGHVDEVVSGLSERLEDMADVVATQTLLDDGAFGPEVSDTFLARLAEVVVLPHPGEAAWWLEPGRFEQEFYGQHGGLSPDEVEIPLLAFVA